MNKENEAKENVFCDDFDDNAQKYGKPNMFFDNLTNNESDRKNNNKDDLNLIDSMQKNRE